jgi:adenine C2-methylase RlmN of 23S rRNA A2503 and tRNA A37
MLKGINDREDDLARLKKLVDKEFTIELAEFNPFEGCDFEPSEHIEHFANSLENEGFNLIVLHSKEGHRGGMWAITFSSGEVGLVKISICQPVDYRL